MKNLYWKIQTIPVTEKLEVGSKEFNLYKEKYREHNKLETDKDVIEDYRLNASKNPLWAKIYSLSIGFVDEATNVARIKVFKGNEKDILQNFLNTCNEHFNKSKITAFNFSFLLPFLRSRMIKNGMKLQGLHDGLIDIGRKPWTITGLDVQDHYKGLGWFSNSLEEMAYTCNLETDFIDGKDVYNYFLAEKEEELNQSLIDETFTLINVHRIITGEEPCTELNSTVVIVESTEEVELTLFEKLNANKGVFASELLEIKSILKKDKLTKKEKDIVFELIRASLSDIDPNFGKVKNDKEVEQIINQLKEQIEN